MSILKRVYSQKVLLILIGMVIFASVSSPYFLTFQNVTYLVTQLSIFGIMALAMTFVILNKEFDLSIGAVMAFSGIFMVKMIPQTGIIVAILLTLLLGVIIGLITGFLVAYLGLNSFVVTLCAMFFYNGLALSVSGGRPASAQDPVLNYISSGTFLGIPNLIVMLLILTLLADYVLRKTKYGRNVYAVGGDEQVARLTGISVRFYKISVFVISSVAAALAGILLTGMLNSASPFVGSSAALTVISAVVIGGTSLAGGEGSIPKTLMGLFILGILDNLLGLLNVHSFYQTFILGALLVFVIGWDFYARSKKQVLVAH
ncbi:ABC transporter permease [Alkalihalobacillus sp. MEB130]|uniref:ABC transporter permease n=1 Tax=Alkalihalobacillus sp. MEB130 TaxID=2976704 RepID=UPI0028DD8A9B|nr:ABC transporter permease [Alkalihalobacillus sp. MEB130]MDT8860739.1 ABC transporter permease [Alkalihalobacillus sp. MEB130]